MAAPRVCVLRAPGTNCEIETAFAFDSCGAQSDAVHLFRLIEQPEQLDAYQILCIPGGFSYGDDIGSGVVFASQMRSRLKDVVARFLAADKLVLGICNGFQTLLKAGVLPDGADSWSAAETAPRSATLTWNTNGKYTARWVRLKVTSSKNVFLRGIDEIDLPVAHAEGRLVARDESVAQGWQDRGQAALKYVPWQSAANETGPAWSTNPNGSLADLAGLGDPSGRILGLMPHPERFLFATQHPQWTRRGLTGAGEGVRIFQNAVEYFR
ncbi:MAG: phosphoribosylformylglycinamidine synthase subunit PurQ [Planctomycetaceae bacterium]|nr:phosphoribosylformylglycinamidine synthase subunit PurQ [Planctomycetaceae bacterium]